jgi:hypothetical protein
MCNSSWCFFFEHMCRMPVTATFPLQRYWIILGRPSSFPGLWIEWMRKTKCAWEMFRFSSDHYSLLDWTHALVCRIVPSVTAFILQDLFSLNQLKISTTVSLMIVIQSFYHPIYSIAESRLLYQQLCGMQKWTGRHVRCDMDQWLCLCDRVAFMHVASIRPQPYITHLSSLVPFWSKATCHTEQVHGSWNQSWRLMQHIFVHMSLFCSVRV